MGCAPGHAAASQLPPAGQQAAGEEPAGGDVAREEATDVSLSFALIDRSFSFAAMGSDAWQAPGRKLDGQGAAAGGEDRGQAATWQLPSGAAGVEAEGSFELVGPGHRGPRCLFGEASGGVQEDEEEVEREERHTTGSLGVARGVARGVAGVAGVASAGLHRRSDSGERRGLLQAAVWPEEGKGESDTRGSTAAKQEQEEEEELQRLLQREALLQQQQSNSRNSSAGGQELEAELARLRGKVRLLQLGSLKGRQATRHLERQLLHAQQQRARNSGATAATPAQHPAGAGTASPSSPSPTSTTPTSSPAHRVNPSSPSPHASPSALHPSPVPKSRPTSPSPRASSSALQPSPAPKSRPTSPSRPSPSRPSPSRPLLPAPLLKTRSSSSITVPLPPLPRIPSSNSSFNSSNLSGAEPHSQPGTPSVQKQGSRLHQHTISSLARHPHE